MLLNKTCSSVVPDYFAGQIIKWRWIAFPWQLWEDMTGFIGKLQAEGIRDRLISRELRERYCVKLSEGILREILSQHGDFGHPRKGA